MFAQGRSITALSCHHMTCFTLLYLNASLLRLDSCIKKISSIKIIQIQYLAYICLLVTNQFEQCASSETLFEAMIYHSWLVVAALSFARCLLLFSRMKVGNAIPGPDEIVEPLVKSRCTRNMAANYEQKMLVLLPPVKRNESNFRHLTSLSRRCCCCGETTLPCWCSAVGSNGNEPLENQWQPLTCTLFKKQVFRLISGVAPSVVIEGRGLERPLQEALGQHLTCRSSRCFDHHSKGPPERRQSCGEIKQRGGENRFLLLFVKFKKNNNNLCDVNHISAFGPRHLHHTMKKKFK